MGEEFVDVPKYVRVDVKGKKNFVNFLTTHRPLDRQAAHGNSFPIRCGLLSPDATILDDDSSAPSYSIEIKPKQGWHIRDLRPNVLERIGIENCDVRKCRFCAMQYLKVKLKSLNSNAIEIEFSVAGGKRANLLHWELLSSGLVFRVSATGSGRRRNFGDAVTE